MEVPIAKTHFFDDLSWLKFGSRVTNASRETVDSVGIKRNQYNETRQI